jgi:hypothetical protein
MIGLLTFFADVGEKIPGATVEEIETILAAPDLTPQVARLIKKIWSNKDFQDLALKADDAQVQGGIYERERERERGGGGVRKKR